VYYVFLLGGVDDLISIIKPPSSFWLTFVWLSVANIFCKLLFQRNLLSIYVTGQTPTVIDKTYFFKTQKAQCDIKRQSSFTILQLGIGADHSYEHNVSLIIMDFIKNNYNALKKSEFAKKVWENNFSLCNPNLLHI
jgi:hypothetical protein